MVVADGRYGLQSIAMWMQNLFAIGAPTVFAFAATAGLWKWLGQKWIEQRLAKGMEKFKSQQQLALEQVRHQTEIFKIELKAGADSVNERLKNSLQMMALEHQVRFSKLHEERAKVIEELDQRLYQLQCEGQVYVQDIGRGGDEKYLEWKKKFMECKDLLDSKQIYLTERLYSQIYEYLDTVKQPLIKVWSITGCESGPSHEVLRNHSQEILSAIEEANTTIPAMRQALIKEFRALLGGGES